MSRSIAEITPTDSDWRSPNGEPIAATGSPTGDRGVRAERQRPQRQALRVDLEQRHVGVGVLADDLGLDAVAVGELDVDLARLLGVLAVALRDDVRVGGDLAVAVEHEARADAAAPAARDRVEAARPEQGDDGHDALALVLEDRLRVEALAVALALDDLDARGLRLGASEPEERVLAVVVAAEAAAGDRPAAEREGERRQAVASLREVMRAAPVRRSSGPGRSARTARRACARPARGRSPGRARRPAPRRWR